MRVLVTGGAGFIGSELVKQLVKKNYTVRVVDNLSKASSKKPLDCEFISTDLRDKERTQQVFKGADVCINLAARIGGVGYIHKYPAQILSDNNAIYTSTFEAAAKNNIKRMVFISSSMVFESSKKFPTKESELIITPPPISAYGFSKLVGEYYCRAFYEQYGLEYVICRPFNAYGPNEYPAQEVGMAHVIPDLIKKILDGQYPIRILGDGNQIRCFTHISDLASGIIAVMESQKARNEDFNIANSQPTTINELLVLLWKLTKQRRKLKIIRTKGFPYDIQKRIPDIRKIKNIVGWEPTISLEEGLAEVITWFKKIFYA